MSSASEDHAAASARAAVVGLEITGVSFLHDFIEVHLGDVVLTGLTPPFGMIDCRGVGADAIVSLIGRTVDDFVVEHSCIAVDSGASRLAFPVGGQSPDGPESVRLVRPARAELGIERAMWIW